jgi:hypothetical protein
LSEVPITSRSNWANLNWKEAQHQIGLVLHTAGFIKFEEKSLGNSNRADVMVIRSTPSEIIFGIVEVKTYRNVTPSMAEKAMKQSCRYLTACYNQVDGNQRWGKKNKRYFATVVFTRDYPNVIFDGSYSQYKAHLPSGLIENNLVEIFSSVPEQLIKKLQDRHLLGPNQNSLNDYYKI